MITITERDVVSWKPYNLPRLREDLAAAGLPVWSEAERHLDTQTLRVEFDADESLRGDIIAVLEAHDPAALTAEEQAAEDAQQAREAALDVVRDAAAADPAYAALAVALGVTLD